LCRRKLSEIVPSIVRESSPNVYSEEGALGFYAPYLKEHGAQG